MKEYRLGKNILGLDPGRDKCGVAVLAADNSVLYQRVIDTEKMPDIICSLREEYEADILVIGNGTTSKEAQKRIGGKCPSLHLEIVDEYFTTQLARKEYWNAKPPRGWRRFLPTSMQVPPEPVDDFVAVILARRYLEENTQK